MKQYEIDSENVLRSPDGRAVAMILQAATVQEASVLGDALNGAAKKTLRDALKRAVPWLGRLIADKGHLECVCPNDAVGALQQAEAALKLE
jgi:hypothetical protein